MAEPAGIASLLATLTSPAKLAFFGYCLLAYAGKIPTSKWDFLAVAVLFLFIQVFHDDYLRIWLNIRAEQTRGGRGPSRS